jgi:hypothetical protein
MEQVILNNQINILCKKVWETKLDIINVNCHQTRWREGIFIKDRLNSTNRINDEQRKAEKLHLEITCHQWWTKETFEK